MSANFCPVMSDLVDFGCVNLGKFGLIKVKLATFRADEATIRDCHGRITISKNIMVSSYMLIHSLPLA